MKRKPTTDDANNAETIDADWMEPFKAPGFRAVFNVGVMTPQQRAEIMASGGRFTNMGKFVEMGVQTSQAQTDRAKKPRGKKGLASIIRMLAKRDGSAKELWPVLLDKLDAAGCEPTEDNTSENPRQWTITYTDEGDHERKVTLDRFQARLGENRKTD